jgi:hypothetical protein
MVPSGSGAREEEDCSSSEVFTKSAWLVAPSAVATVTARTVKSATVGADEQACLVATL